MSIVSLTPALIAVTRVGDLAPEYQSPSDPNSAPIAVIAVVILVAVGLAVVAIKRRGQSLVAPSSDPLTLEITDAHGLDIHHRVVLDQVARHAGIEHTAELFLSKEFFDRACHMAAQVKKLRPGQRVTLGEVRRNAFG